MTFWITVMCGQIAYDWKTIPIGRLSGPMKMPRLGSDATLPSISIVPRSLRSSPAIMRSVVVLPHPLGPSRATSFPSGMSRSRPSTAFAVTVRPG